MSTVILGAGGMLGRALTREFPGATPFSRKQLDVTDAAVVADFLTSRVSLVINAAADTRVDLAESSDEHLLTNDVAVGALSARCREVGVRLVHISTDYVFDGRGHRPYREDDRVSPVNAYGAGKLAGERKALASGARALVVRTSWVFGPGGHNFVDTILKLAESGKKELKVVSDQMGRPTFAQDLALAIRLLVEVHATGIVHFAGGDETTWFELARETLALAGLEEVEVTPCTSAEFPRPAKRPVFSVLDTTKFQLLTGEAPRSWRKGLALYVEERGVSRPPGE